MTTDGSDRASHEPTVAEIERAWRGPSTYAKPTGLRRSYYAGMAYCGLVFSYVWRFLGLVIIVMNSWMGLHEPVVRAAWFPLWGSALQLVGVLFIGHLLGRLASWGIRLVTGHAPWSGNK